MDIPSDPVTPVRTLPPDFWQKLEADPYRYGLYHVLRWLDARSGTRKPLGRDSLPSREPVRLRQEPSMAFAPSTICDVDRDKDGPPIVSILSYGLFGPNGPLPLHLTEYVRERIVHHRDHTLSAFADIFHHRLIALFYRAWADAQSTVSLDRPEENFSRHVASLINQGHESLKQRDSIMDHAKYFFAGHLVRQSRNPEGIIQILKTFFSINVSLKEFVPQWIALDPSQQLGLNGTMGLGQDTILGSSVRDAQHKFRLSLGPLSRKEFDEFMPGTRKAKQLTHWLRHYVGIELNWDVLVILKKEEVKGIHLGEATALGLGSWMGERPENAGDADDLIIDYELRERLRGTNASESAL